MAYQPDRSIAITNKSNSLILIKCQCQKSVLNSQSYAESYENSKSSAMNMNANVIGKGGGGFGYSNSSTQKSSKSGSWKKAFSPFIDEDFCQILPGKSRNFAVEGDSVYISVAGITEQVFITNWRTSGTEFIYQNGDLDELKQARFSTVGASFVQDDKGSGGSQDAKFYGATNLKGGSFDIGYICKGRCENTQIMIIDHATPGKDVARPIRCSKIWDDHGSGNSFNYQLWRPIPPNGFVAMSDIPNFGTKMSNSTNDWGTDQIWCVSNKLVKGANMGGSVWTDKKIGSSDDGSIWRVEGTGFMIGTKGYSKPNRAVYTPK
eukprot:174973_1